MTNEQEPLVTLTVTSQVGEGEAAEIGTAEVTDWMIATSGYKEAAAHALEAFAAQLRNLGEPDGPTEDRG